MTLSIVGTGYVGPVAGACIAEARDHVTGFDTDYKKFSTLKNGVLPTYEPDLEALVARNVTDGRLRFVSNMSVALDGCEAIFLVVGTPQGALACGSRVRFHMRFLAGPGIDDIF